MQVFASGIDACPVAVDAEADELIAELRMDLADKTGIDRTDIKIVFNSKIMDDDGNAKLPQVKDWIDWTGWNSVFGGFSFQVAFGLMIVSGVYLNNYRATNTLYYTNKPDNQDILGH
ncbi:hypothetical protein FOZ60_010722 [Perkinsus olseni]|uniref:Ubiquitin-like domain-containing protein n=1 Tax=Perkinsus olseni TaxID=32597 RepID=A0A7J6PC33_PEROL|nr:hypothetical protein FOZ60_010722 [Perkinsus olseni]